MAATTAVVTARTAHALSSTLSEEDEDSEAAAKAACTDGSDTMFRPPAAVGEAAPGALTWRVDLSQSGETREGSRAWTTSS